MKERPILFSAPMVRALLEGRKTQTRRIIKDAPIERDGYLCTRLITFANEKQVRGIMPSLCPYGKPGDRLWVREAWKTAKVSDLFSPSEMVQACRDAGWKGKTWVPIVYLADGQRENWDTYPREAGRYRHGRFMPRDYSRITLEITEVRVQRLQDITEEDAIAEGSQIPLAELPKSARQAAFTERQAYSRIWESINGAGSWDANPWVWAVSFRRVA